MKCIRKTNGLTWMFLTALICAFMLLAFTRSEKTYAEGAIAVVQVPGEFAAADVPAILSLMNSYRLEACQNGYPDPRSSSQRLSMSDYSEIKWSGDMECIAQVRAVEADVNWGHTRPNGMSCFTVSHNGLTGSAESLAWNKEGVIRGIKQWYDEKADWVAQDRSKVTGHYEFMINPDMHYVGIGCFTSQPTSWKCTAAAFSRESSLSEAQQGRYGQVVQEIEVPASAISREMEGEGTVTIGESSRYQVNHFVTMESKGRGVKTLIQPPLVPSWSSSDSTIASIDNDGLITTGNIGSVNIIASFPDGTSAAMDVSVVKPAPGSELTINDAKYRVSRGDGEVSYIGDLTGQGTVVIPDEVSYYALTYKVTSIADRAFKNRKTLSQVTIGNNVVTIGKEAFYGCSSLKSVSLPVNVRSIGKKAFYLCKKLQHMTIETTRLKDKQVGKNAFGKTKLKVVDVPKNVIKTYGRWMRKKGLSMNVRIE